jgi:hypothetical protein
MTSTDTQHRTPPTTAAWVWRDASLDDVVTDALPLAHRPAPAARRADR